MRPQCRYALAVLDTALACGFPAGILTGYDKPSRYVKVMHRDGHIFARVSNHERPPEHGRRHGQLLVSVNVNEETVTHAAQRVRRELAALVPPDGFKGVRRLPAAFVGRHEGDRI